MRELKSWKNKSLLLGCGTLKFMIVEGDGNG